MFRRLVMLALAVLSAGLVPAQSPPGREVRETGRLEDYVGLINQTFHPEFVRFMLELKEEFEQRGQQEAAGSIKDYLTGNAGTGFVYVAGDGANYVIASHRLITQASGLSIRFAEGAGYSGLSIVAVDEELDLALLAFENGARPFSEGLAPLDRQLREGETVYAAGFPGKGEAPWQSAGGVVSKMYVRIPGDDEIMRFRGPYIRHTARTSQATPGGVLLTADPEAPAGYAVAGIDAGERDRQTACAIPIDRVRDFLERALGAGEDERIALESRVLAFSRLMSLRLPYRRIAAYLSGACTAENTAGILSAINNASGTAIEDIVKAFIDSPAKGINLALAWTVEDHWRGGRDLDFEVETIEQTGADYRTGFLVSGAPAGALWVNEYGIWRIRGFENFTVETPETAAVEKKDGEEDSAEQAAKLRTEYLFSFSLGYGYLGGNHTLMLESSFHQWCLAFGTRLYTGPSYLQGDGLIGLHFPIRVKNRIGIIPFTGAGIGFVRKSAPGRSLLESLDLCLLGQGGLRITSSLAPGLFLQGMYQYSYEVIGRNRSSPHSIAFSVGYGF
jgi:serine protease Do